MDMFSEAFVQFESLLARKINEYPDEKLRARDLRQIIKSTADSVKAKHRWTPEKSAVRKLVKSLMSDAEGSYAGTEEFRRQDALLRHFGGLPEDAEEGYPFMVVRTGTRQTSIFTLGNGFDREYLGKMTLRPKRAVILTREGRKELDLENLPLPDTDESFPSNETVEETTSE